MAEYKTILLNFLLNKIIILLCHLNSNSISSSSKITTIKKLSKNKYFLNYKNIIENI